ncbi:yaeQ protein [Vibrio sp. JCM 19236]|nr:yaeQ protein [Vibrio sp. JCM 19236]
MALKPTIYKFRVNLADTNQNKFDDFNLTVALHPSETKERMLARMVAFALNYTPELAFTKGFLIKSSRTSGSTMMQRSSSLD